MAIQLALILFLVGNFSFAVSKESSGGCEAALLNYKTQLSRLVEMGSQAKEAGRSDPETARAIRALVTDLYAKNLLSGILGGVSEALALAREIIGEQAAVKEWSRVSSPMIAKPKLVGDLSAIELSGVNRVYAMGVQNDLLLNGKPIPSKAMYGLRLYVFLNDEDERYPQHRDAVIRWKYIASLNLTGGQKRSLFERAGEIQSALENLPFGIEPREGEHLLIVEVVTSDALGFFSLSDDQSDDQMDVVDEHINRFFTGKLSEKRLYRVLMQALSKPATQAY